jgi:hypothetical protein
MGISAGQMVQAVRRRPHRPVKSCALVERMLQARESPLAAVGRKGSEAAHIEGRRSSIRKSERSTERRRPTLVTITDSSPDSITEIPQALIGVVGLFGV